MSTQMNSCNTFAIELPEINQEQLQPIVDFLATILAEERLRELHQAEEVDKP